MFEGSTLEPDCSVSDSFCNGSSPAGDGSLSDSHSVLTKLDDASRTSKVVDADKKENDLELATQLGKALLRQNEELRLTNENIIQEFNQKIEVMCFFPILIVLLRMLNEVNKYQQVMERLWNRSLHYNWAMYAHASQAFSTYTLARDCTD